MITLYELGCQYEEDVRTLTKQVERAKLERAELRKIERKTPNILREIEILTNKIATYNEMKLECRETSKQLKNYYRNTKQR